MLSQAIAKKLLMRAQTTGVRCFSVNAKALQTAVADPAHVNWAQFFQSVKPTDIAGTDAASIGQLFKVLSHTGEHNDLAEKQTELYAAIDEYFKLKFRKMSAKEALAITLPLGQQDSAHKLSVLDDKFWVWETLDEALRPVIDDISEDEVLQLCSAFAANFKGSECLWDNLIKRVHFHGATPF